MDIEQLKLILQTVEATTGNAKDVAVYWLAIEMAKVAMAYIVGGGVAIGAFVLLKKVIESCFHNSMIYQMRALILPDQAYGSLLAVERRKIWETFNRGVKEKQ